MSVVDAPPEVEPIAFEGWPQIARLNRGIVVTEKIDGTNAAVIITSDGRVGAQSKPHHAAHTGEGPGR